MTTGRFFYRPEIDGLRAIAVTPVVLFHSGVAGFAGGFVGVDIFFVISGYLITSILLTEITEGKFSLVNFYERRARRIFPVLFFMSMVTIPLAWFIMIPNELEDFGQSLVAMGLFLSNAYFYLKIDYFSGAAENLPLLHMWSLAVEEQFYLFFPLLLTAIWKFKSYRLIAIIFSIIAAVSFFASDIISSRDAMAGFFLTPYRIWELLVGSLCALFLAVQTVNSSSRANILAAIGLGLITFSIFWLDKGFPFPGRYALPVVIGTALLILFCQKDGFVTRLLSHRWFVLIGLTSYSVYVWHFPLIAFARLHFDNDLPHALLPVLGLLSFPIGWLSWRYLERPFRDKKTFRRHHIFLMTAIGTAIIFTIGLTLHLSKGIRPSSKAA